MFKKIIKKGIFKKKKQKFDRNNSQLDGKISRRRYFNENRNVFFEKFINKGIFEK